jgi:3,4-dihydroxy 2-butanone 4-phosphate synthase/GTP cyclohydrolase II
MLKKQNYQFKEKVSVNLPTKYGAFVLVAYENELGEYHLALVYGDVFGRSAVPVRIHSSCITGETFGSLKCDCGEQLSKSLTFIKNYGYGVLIYLFQEGRGIGLVDKLRAYKLQESGLDTVEANLKLGLPVDARKYEVAAEIIKQLGIKTVSLISNNPDKVDGIRGFGIKTEKIVNLPVTVNGHNKKYLHTKAKKLGHRLFLIGGGEHVDI